MSQITISKNGKLKLRDGGEIFCHRVVPNGEITLDVIGVIIHNLQGHCGTRDIIDYDIIPFEDKDIRGLAAVRYARDPVIAKLIDKWGRRINKDIEF